MAKPTGDDGVEQRARLKSLVMSQTPRSSVDFANDPAYFWALWGF